MKRQLLATMMISILSLSTALADTTVGQNSNQTTTDLSYTLGYTTGQRILQGIQKENADLKTDAFANGISDAIMGKQGRLNADQMRKILETFQNNMMLEQQKKAQTAIEANRKQLVKSANSPIDGNAKGKVTLVEFFDYQCVHCRRFAPDLMELKKTDPELRIVYKELPIFGENSNFASRAALAAGKQGQYQALHAAFMSSDKPLTNDQVLLLAQNIKKLNLAQLKKDMDNKDIVEELQHNQQLAQAIGIVGTPSLVITTTEPMKYTTDPKSMEELNSVFIPGAPPIQMIQETISNVQGKAMSQAVRLPEIQEQPEPKGTWPGV